MKKQNNEKKSKLYKKHLYFNKASRNIIILKILYLQKAKKGLFLQKKGRANSLGNIALNIIINLSFALII